MAKREPRMVPLGYGKYVRADRIFALVRIEGPDRGDGSRTLVHVEGVTEPLVASRSDRAIAADIESALGHAGTPAAPRATAVPEGQETLL